MSTVVFRGGPADGRVQFVEDDPYTLRLTGFIKTKDGPFFDDRKWVVTTSEYQRTKEFNEHSELIYDFVREF